MARPKKKRDKDVRDIKKAVKSGEIQTDPIEDYYLDPYGRPIVQMLNEAPAVPESKPSDSGGCCVVS